MKSRECGFSLIELLIVVGVISTLASIGVPVLLRARIASNEASAIGSVRNIVAAQADYHSLNSAYGGSLLALSTTCPAITIPYISKDLEFNGVLKSGYVFSVVPGLGGIPGANDACGTPVSSAFYATAAASSVGSTGNRGFAADSSTMAVWEDVTGLVPAQPFTASPTVAPLGR